MKEKFSSCTNPYWTRHPKLGWVPCPCGKCYNCLVKDSNDLFFRCRVETANAKSSYFITLTYDDSVVPTENGELVLRKKDLQDFFKRVRKSLTKKNVNLRYFYVGEYGGEFNRPHYHLALWLDAHLPYTIIYSIISSEWHFGIIKINFLQTSRLHYLVKYFNKIDDRPHLVKPFRNWSKGLGASYLTKNTINYHHANLTTITHRYGRTFSLPKYLKNKIFNENELLQIAKQAKEFNDDFQSDFYASHRVLPRDFYANENLRKLVKAKNQQKIIYSERNDMSISDNNDFM